MHEVANVNVTLIWSLRLVTSNYCMFREGVPHLVMETKICFCQAVQEGRCRAKGLFQTQAACQMQAPKAALPPQQVFLKPRVPQAVKNWPLNLQKKNCMWILQNLVSGLGFSRNPETMCNAYVMPCLKLHLLSWAKNLASYSYYM